MLYLLCLLLFSLFSLVHTKNMRWFFIPNITQPKGLKCCAEFEAWQCVNPSGDVTWPACNRAPAGPSRNDTLARQDGTPCCPCPTSHLITFHHGIPMPWGPCGVLNLITLGDCVLGFLFERPPSSHGCWIIVTCTPRNSATMDFLHQVMRLQQWCVEVIRGDSSFGAFLHKHVGTMPLIDRNLGIQQKM